ncbi:MAG: 3'(2'),5'-bisphosphate nucleotidase CysQ [Deltaproteobacteria bacterium]|nr:3'(2'),5'-bisphosphate nucleotidase CysQ [Deltaproteobacteria bacterium]
MESFSRELATASDLAVHAGAHILGYHGKDVAVDRKAGDEPVTRADREASELILDGLHREFPGDIMISEEAPDDPARLMPGVRVWFVDPLDGTRDFIRGHDGFAVMIGLVVGGRPRLGVVYQPIGSRLFFAAPGVGARLRSPDGERVLHCSTVSDLAEIRLVASKSHRTGKIDEIKGALGISSELNIGSVGLKLGLIALAERDLYVNPSSKSKAWDTCAPEAILEEAGGKITDLWGHPLRYDQEDLRNLRGLVASNGFLHASVLEKLRPLFPEPPE